jgi:hypothetical protein
MNATVYSTVIQQEMPHMPLKSSSYQAALNAPQSLLDKKKYIRPLITKKGTWITHELQSIKWQWQGSRARHRQYARIGHGNIQYVEELSNYYHSTQRENKISNESKNAPTVPRKWTLPQCFERIWCKASSSTGALLDRSGLLISGRVAATMDWLS